jgi:hypothetical protein
MDAGKPRTMGRSRRSLKQDRIAQAQDQSAGQIDRQQVEASGQEGEAKTRLHIEPAHVLI